ncbi:MAG: protein phosphatase 2C domain-containing protein [Kofleriaceae bacterium]
MDTMTCQCDEAPVEAGPPAVEVAVASVAGAAHRRLGRPNQDAAHVVRVPGGVVAVVCDGCGSGRRSEVGATLGARLWTQVVAARLRAGATVGAVDIDALAAEVLARLAVVAAALGDDVAEVTRDLLLFTSVVAVVTDAQVVVAAIGDGVVVLDEEAHVLGPFPDNAPPYLAEGWFGPVPAARVWSSPRTASGRLILATDGAVPLVDGAGTLAALVDDAAVYRNPAVLERRLALRATDQIALDWDAQVSRQRAALLDDDTTLAVVRWGAR